MIRTAQSAVRTLHLLIAFSLALPLFLLLISGWHSFRSIARDLDDTLERRLDVQTEQAIRAFKTIELALGLSAEIFDRLTDEEILSREAEYSARLSDAVGLPSGQSIWVFDRNGRPLVSTYTPNTPKTIDNSSRDYFQAQTTSDAGTFIGRVIQPRVGSKPIFTVSRRRSDSRGAFNGVYAAAIISDELSRFYERLAVTPWAYLSLVRSDGVFLARYPEAAQPEAKLDENSVLRRLLLTQPESGRFNAVSPLDGIDRIITYRKLTAYPAYVMAGLESRAVWLLWWKEFGPQLLLTLLATSIVIFVLSLALRRTQRFYVEAERRQAAEAALRQAQRMEGLGQLTGGVAHDFNNLLMVVTGAVSRLRQQRNSSEQDERLLKMIAEAAHKGARLTHQLLSFARRQPIAPEVIDLNEHLGHIQPMLEQALKEGVELHLDLPPGQCRVKVDVGELDVALLNLVLNARDAMPAGGKITLSAEERNLSAGDLYLPAGGRFIVLSVADTGIGISPENIERIFEPFFTTKDRGAGTGLGLSQVYGFAKQAGGSVAVESAPGSGTTVRIVLPCASDSLPSKVPEGSGREHSFSGLNAMVVEDDPAVAKLCTGYLEDMGFKVNSFSSTSAALEALRGNAPPSIILSDILLPGKMDGVEFAHHCRRATPSSAVILMTGYGGARFDRRQIEFPLIRKPFTGEELRALVEKSIASRTTSFA